MKIQKWFLVFAISGAGVIILVLALLGSKCFTRGFTGQLVDVNNKPLQGAFVLFIYKNDTLNPGGAIENVFASGIMETDNNGEFHIPARFCCFIPWFQTQPQPWVEAAYSSKTHSWASRSDFHESYNDEEMNIHRVVLPDFNNDPQQRAAALELMINSLDSLIGTPRKPLTHLKAAAGVNERLVSTLYSEHDILRPKLFPDSPPPPTMYLSESNIISSHFTSLRLRKSRFLSLRSKIETYASEIEVEQQKK